MTSKPTYEELELEVKELRKAKDELDRIFELTPDLIGVADANKGIFRHVSHAWERTLGRSLEELLSRPFMELIHPDDRVATTEEIEDQQSGKVVTGFTNRYRHKDGSYRTIEWHATEAQEDGTVYATGRDVTESKQIEDALKQSREALGRMFTFADYMVCIADLEAGYFTKISPAFTRHLGWSEEEMLSKPILDFIHPDDVERTSDIIRQQLEEGVDVIQFENRYRTKQGDFRWFEWSANPVPEEGITYSAAYDITERKRAEEILRESEERHREFLENYQGIAYQSEYRTFAPLLFSGAVQEITGYEPEEFLSGNLKWTAVIHPEDRQSFLDEGKKFATADNFVSAAEYRIIRNDGGIRFLRDVARLFDINGTPTIQGTVVDITEGKRAKRELQRTADRLQSLWNIVKIDDADIKTLSDHVLAEIQRITESTYAFYGLITEDEKVMQLHAWSTETMEDCQVEDQYLSFPIDKAGIWADAVRERRTITLNDFQSVKSGRKGMPEGHVPITRLMAAPLVVHDKVISIAAVANKPSDYTAADEEQVLAFLRNAQILVDRRQAEEDKAELENQLQQARKLEAIGTLAGGIAHDFNNILGIILGNVELSLDDIPDLSPAKGNLREIRSATLRGRDVVRQILSFSRHSLTEKKPMSVTEVVEETLKLMRSSIPRSVDIEVDLSDDSDTVLADQAQISQVLMNLCTNAYQATGEDGRLRVSVKILDIDAEPEGAVLPVPKGKCVRLSVNDSGPGIAPEILEGIFDPYFTTKKVGEGTGMGLAVVRGIVSNSGGGISVESIVGEGATFHVYLPLADVEAAHDTETSERMPTGTERILLLDDEEGLVRAYASAISSLGYDVVPCTSPNEALGIFRRESDNIALVITDMTMPEMTGEVLTRELQKIKPDIPIIICTGHSEKVAEESVRELGIAAYALKPIMKRDIAVKIRKALDVP